MLSSQSLKSQGFIYERFARAKMWELHIPCTKMTYSSGGCCYLGEYEALEK